MMERLATPFQGGAIPLRRYLSRHEAVDRVDSSRLQRASRMPSPTRSVEAGRASWRRAGPGPLLSILLAAIVAPADAWGQEAVPRPSAQSANPRISLATGYAVDPRWPARSPALDWGAVAGIAIGRDGEIWTFHRGEEPVRVFSTSGQLLRSWGRGEFREPHQLRIDGGGNVWLVDSGLHFVRKYSSKCELLLTLGTKGVSGEDPAHFNRPTDVAVAPSGDVFVADGYGNNRIVHFDAGGKFVKSWVLSASIRDSSTFLTRLPSTRKGGSMSRTATTCGSRSSISRAGFSTSGGVCWCPGTSS